MDALYLTQPTAKELASDFGMMQRDILTEKSADRLAQFAHFESFFAPQQRFWESLTVKEHLALINDFVRQYGDMAPYAKFYEYLSKHAHAPKFTNFNVMMFDQLIHRYRPKTIVDPTMGWGQRMIMAMAHGIHYLGIDIREDSIESNKNLVAFLKREFIELPATPSLLCTDGATLGGDLSRDFDMLFTSPPYFDAEIYSDKGAENLSYDEYLDWWRTLATNAYNNNIKTFAFQITPKYGEDLRRMTELAGYKQVDIIKNTRDNGTLSRNHVDTKGRVSKRQFGQVYVFSRN